MKRVDFSEVTGGPRRASRPRACREPLGRELGAERPPGRTTRGRKARPSRRALSFRNLLMGEIPPQAGRGAKLPRRYVAEKTSPRALELKKSPSSLRKYELCKALSL